MNTKKSLLAIAAIALFALSSCTSTSSSDDDKLYEENAVDKSEIKILPQG
ncbi:peptidase m28 [Cellulophaga sp. HaHa_2_95]|nr:peptidase m28 [Cellulophaga sp. HaHa_2_95]QXP54376.1 peptidase m28 [Cellulophaga sp. HaHa_2_95]